MNAMKFVSAMVLATVCGTAVGQESWPPCCPTGDCGPIQLKYESKLSVLLSSTAVINTAASELVTIGTAYAELERAAACCVTNCFRTQGVDDGDSLFWSFPSDPGGGVSFVNVGASVGENESPHVWADLIAKSHMPSVGTWTEILELSGSFAALGPTRCECNTRWDAHVRGYASGRYWLELDDVGSGITLYRVKQKSGPEWTSMYLRSLYRMYAFVALNAGLGRSAEIHTTAIMSSRGVVVAPGMTIDPGTGDYVFETEFESEELEMTIDGGQLMFDDAAMDANGDGRFNYLDAAAIRAEISSTNPAWLRFDFNNSGAIDEFDADLVDLMITDNIDSGLLGDIDGDGLVDCTTDLPLLYPFPTATFGDVDYVIQLDANVDGLLNADDLKVLQRVVFRADFDHSGFVDTDDLDAFTAAFTIGDESADVDLSGFVDTDDHSAFMAAFTNGC